jgi:hypothetical protein
MINLRYLLQIWGVKTPFLKLPHCQYTARPLRRAGDQSSQKYPIPPQKFAFCKLAIRWQAICITQYVAVPNTPSFTNKYILMQNSNQAQKSNQNPGSNQDQEPNQTANAAKTAQQNDQKDQKNLADGQTNQPNPKLNPIHNNLETNKG